MEPSDWYAIFLHVTAIIGICAQIAAITPTKRDDEILGPIVRAVDFIGANYGHAKNDNRRK